MKWLHKIGSKLEQLAAYLQTFGPAGLFAIALLDSAFIPLPGGPDAVMLLLSIPPQNHAWMPLYALSATVGSVIGCQILYYISRRAGRNALEKFSESKQARVKELVDKYDVLSVLVASILPPPFPFKLFVITAGVFRLSPWRFAAAVAVGRAFRFFLEGFIAVEFGEKAKGLIEHNAPAVGLGLAALIVAVFVARGLLKRKEKKGSGGRETGAATRDEAEPSAEL
ncbi:MAG TPA: VTT domain-containing protein [Pyrinomonadaceae bacterium]|nr:VTT domain-containing protein [Pyrinomonadaceae bacterium]